MRGRQGAAIVLAAMVVAVTRAEAAESVTGRWALDPSSCWGFGLTAAQSPLIVTDGAVRWHDDACRIRRAYKTGDTVHIQALCWSLTGERAIPVSLRPHGGPRRISWDRGACGDLRRCQ